ncbi:MAG: 3-dehydroquinate dehydratase, type [Bacteroidota bacterium]|jgi:3-dehydroquinate dehydratase-2|nr:3-dehydroquinate dehydratase, type [Bacteroidota bacterium]
MNNVLKIAIINGPNLNLLGKREKEIYGDTSFDDYFQGLKKKYPRISFDYFQSNVEGELIDKLHEFGFDADGIILNGGAYTHTSVAIADAVAAIKTPVIEVHISNIFSREDFRHVSYLGKYCLGSISGFGLKSYELALESFVKDFI